MPERDRVSAQDIKDLAHLHTHLDPGKKAILDETHDAAGHVVSENKLDPKFQVFDKHGLHYPLGPKDSAILSVGDDVADPNMGKVLPFKKRTGKNMDSAGASKESAN